MRLIEGRDHFRCEHCETFRFAAPLADSIDRVVLLGDVSEQACPTCDTPLARASLDGAAVLCCETCRGLLLESDVFAHVNRRRRAEFDGAETTPSPLDREQLRRALHCPACQRRMETHPFYGPGSVVIDSCAPCRLVWVDYGELATIERAPGKR